MDINLNITVQAPGIEKALVTLANAYTAIPAFTQVAATLEAPAEVKSGRSRKNTADKADKTETKPAEPVKEETPEVPEETSEAEPAKADAPKVTVEQVRNKLRGLSLAGKKDQVKSLLTSYGVSKLTDIPEEKFAEVLAAAEEL